MSAARAAVSAGSVSHNKKRKFGDELTFRETKKHGASNGRAIPRSVTLHCRFLPSAKLIIRAEFDNGNM
ncbi:MAG: hypothetical protein ACOX74_07435 [Lachnospiraceae bacterium]